MIMTESEKLMKRRLSDLGFKKWQKLYRKNKELGSIREEASAVVVKTNREIDKNVQKMHEIYMNERREL